MASNPSPSAVLHRRINFATVNETNGNVIPEPFRVFGPYAQGVRITRLQLGNKAVIPLTTETGEGAFFLKLHFPHVVGNNMNMSTRGTNNIFGNSNTSGGNIFSNNNSFFFSKVSIKLSNLILKFNFSC